MRYKFLPYSLLLILLLCSCEAKVSIGGAEDNNNSQGSSEWLIPVDEVVDGGPGQDGIRSIDLPVFVPPEEIDYIVDDRLIIALNYNGQIRAYPHQILDWHEIVNDTFGQDRLTIHYCPLTGTGMAWNALIEDRPTEFGVSGLLFRNNLILYDRNTNSYWSQMRVQSVHGDLAGYVPETIPVIETKWSTWVEMFPDSKVLRPDVWSTEGYKSYAYGKSYLTDHDEFIFPVKRTDNRLQNKDRVHGVVFPGADSTSYRIRIYPPDLYIDSIRVINEIFNNEHLVFISHGPKDLSAVYSATTQSDQTVLSFEPVQDALPIVMTDEEGNLWDIFGIARQGPRTGEQLGSPINYKGYWFAWVDMFDEICFYPHQYRCHGISIE